MTAQDIARRRLRSASLACAPKNCRRPAAWTATSFSRNSRRNSRESTRTGRKKPGRQADPALTVQGNAAARNDHMDMGMMGERRPPSVQHGRHADPCAQMFGIGGDRDHRLGGSLEQKVVDHGLVLIGDVADRRRQGEDHMVIWARAAARPRARPAMPAPPRPGTSGNAGCGSYYRR